MKPLLAILIILTTLLVAHLVLLGLAIGEGYLLHWAIPTIDLPTAVVIGLVATAATIYMVLKIVGMMLIFPLPAGTKQTEDEDDEADDEEDDEDEEEDEPLPSQSREFPIDWHRLAPRHRRRRRRNR